MFTTMTWASGDGLRPHVVAVLVTALGFSVGSGIGSASSQGNAASPSPAMRQALKDHRKPSPKMVAKSKRCARQAKRHGPKHVSRECRRGHLPNGITAPGAVLGGAPLPQPSPGPPVGGPPPAADHQVVGGLGGGNPFPSGECTWYAAQRRPDLIGKVWGNANQWLDQARSSGVPVGQEAVPGAIAVWGANMGGASGAGHVAYVEAVLTGNRIVVSDSNWVAYHTVSTNRVMPITGIIGYIYGGPAGNGTPPPPPPFVATLDGQAPARPDNKVVVTAGDPSFQLAENVRFNQPASVANFVAVPDTRAAISQFASITGNWPGAVPSNDDHVLYYRMQVGAPASTPPGEYTLRWRIVNQATGQASDLMPSLVLVVRRRGSPDYGPPPAGAPAYAARYVDEDWPRLLRLGERGTMRMIIRNTGTSGWRCGEVNLATDNDAPFPIAVDGAGGVNHNRVSCQDQDGDGYVAPNEQAAFSWTVASAQATAGRFSVHLVKEGSGPHFGQEMQAWLPFLVADADHFPPEVSTGDCSWQWVAQAGDPMNNGWLQVNENQVSRFSITIKNTSNTCAWFRGGAAPFRLGTTSPQDRESGFAVLGDGWIASSRVGLPSDTPVVAPGATVTIPIGMRAASWVGMGRYPEHMAPVIDGKFWLPATQDMWIPVERK